MGFSSKTIKSVNKTIKGEVEMFDPKKEVEALSSGSVVIDKIIGVGGYPKGRLTEIYGDFSSGKTTIALHAIKSCQKEGKGAVFMDYEETFDALYAKALGISMDPADLLVIQPKTLEKGWTWLKDNFANKNFIEECGLLVFDSVAAMVTDEQMDRDPEGTTGIGLQARGLTNFLPWLVKKISKPKITVLLLNQERLNLQKAMNKYAGGPDTLSTGGKAVQFYNTVKLYLKIRGSDTEKRKNPLTGDLEEMKVLNRIRVSCLKNKVRPPFLQGEIIIRYGLGIDNFLALINIAMAKGVISRSGSYYSYESRLTGDCIKIQGKSGMIELFEKDPDEYKALENWFANEEVQAMSETEKKDFVADDEDYEDLTMVGEEE